MYETEINNSNNNYSKNNKFTKKVTKFNISPRSVERIAA